MMIASAAGANRLHASIRFSFFAPHLNCFDSSTSLLLMRETPARGKVSDARTGSSVT